MRSRVEVQNRTIRSSESPESELSRSEKIVALDGGWGWMCVVGCCLMHFLLGGFGRSFGVIYVHMLERFDCTAATGSAIGAVFTSIRMGCGPLVGILVRRFSVRKVTGVGACAFSLGCLLCAFATSPVYMFITYSVISGIGGAMVYFPAVVIVGQYFDKKRGMAMGLSTAGSGLGCIAIPPLYCYSLSLFGYGGSFIVATGMILNFLVCSALYRSLYDTWRGRNVAERRKLRLEADNLVNQTILATECDATPESKLRQAKHKIDEPIEPEQSVLVDVNENSIISDWCGLNSGDSVEQSTEDRDLKSDIYDNRYDSVVSVNSKEENNGSESLVQTAALPTYFSHECGTSVNESQLDYTNFERTFNDSIHDTIYKQINHADGCSNTFKNNNTVYLSLNNPSAGSTFPVSSESFASFDDRQDEPLLQNDDAVVSKCHQCQTISQKLDGYFGISLLANPAFSCFILALGLGTMAYIGAQNLIVAHANEMGVNPDLSVYILSAIGAADTTGRVLSGLLFDIPIIRRLRKFLFTFVLFGSGLSIIGWGFCTNFIQFIFLSLANGAFNGALVTGRPIVVADIVGIKNMPQAFGLTVFCQGIFIGIGPYIAGHLKDVSGTYLMSYIFSGSSSFLAAMLYLIGNRIGTKSSC